jgi:hypothetical protein
MAPRMNQVVSADAFVSRARGTELVIEHTKSHRITFATEPEIPPRTMHDLSFMT